MPGGKGLEQAIPRHNGFSWAEAMPERLSPSDMGIADAMPVVLLGGHREVRWLKGFQPWRSGIV